MRADMLQEAALDAREGNRVVYSSDSGVSVTAKIIGMELASDGNEKFTLALPDGTSMRVSRSAIAPSPSQCATPRPSRNATPNPSPAASRHSSLSPSFRGVAGGSSGLQTDPASPRFCFDNAKGTPSPSPGGMRGGHWSSPGSARGPEPRTTSLIGRRPGGAMERNLPASPLNVRSSPTADKSAHPILSSAFALDRELGGGTSLRSSNAYRRSERSSNDSNDISDDAASASGSYPSGWSPSSKSGVSAYLRSYPKDAAATTKQPGSPKSSPPTSAILVGRQDRRARLQELVGLRDDGIISEDLFQSKQREILNEI